MPQRNVSLAGLLFFASGALLSIPAAAAPTVGTCGATCITILGVNPTPDPARTAIGEPVDARNTFIAGLESLSTDGLKSSFVSTPTATSFNILSGAARLTGVANSPSPALPVNRLTNEACLSGICPGRFDTTDDDGAWWESSTSFTLDFLQGGVSAFGFYATDVGDFDGRLSLTLTHPGGTTDIAVSGPETISGTPTGSLLFFGFADTTRMFTSIRFNLTQTPNQPTAPIDYMGIDDFVAGQAKRSTDVPEPATLALVVASLSALVATRRRRPR